jgi:hypothetical protein
LLAEAFRHPLRYQTRRNVRRATGGLSDDNVHGPRRHFLAEALSRPRDHDQLAFEVHLTLQHCFNTLGITGRLHEIQRLPTSPLAHFMKT